MKTFLRGTRWLVSLVVSLHVLLLRYTTVIADRKVAKADKRVLEAQRGVEFARQALNYSKLSVREFKDQYAGACSEARNVRLAAEAEVKFLGRDL